MSFDLRSGTGALERRTRAAVARLGKDERARRLAGRVREARSAFNEPVRRELRDDHAMRAVLTAVLREDSNAVDVGANYGAVLESIVHLAPAGHHLAFEPIPYMQERLAQRFPTVEVRRAALSDETGETEFSHVLDAPAYSGLRRRGDLPRDATEVECIEVKTERLDDVLADREHVPSLIKIDVEGAELQVLQGARETLERHRPFVLFEHGTGGADLYGTGPNDVFDLLDGVGLRIFDMEGSGPYSRERFEATFTEPIWNFLAAPK